MTEYFNEKEYADTANLYHGYTYVINGEVKVLELPDGLKKMTVAEYKARNPEVQNAGADLGDPAATSAPIPASAIKSITNCDMRARNLPMKRAS